MTRESIIQRPSPVRASSSPTFSSSSSCLFPTELVHLNFVIVQVEPSRAEPIAFHFRRSRPNQRQSCSLQRFNNGEINWTSLILIQAIEINRFPDHTHLFSRYESTLLEIVFVFFENNIHNYLFLVSNSSKSNSPCRSEGFKNGIIYFIII